LRKIFGETLDSFKKNSGLCISFHLVFWGLLAVSRASVLAAFFWNGFKIERRGIRKNFFPLLVAMRQPFASPCVKV
jgi:hypothetical protein